MVQASDFLIALDDGHGPHTAGKRTPFIPSLGRQIRENEFNKAVVDLLEAELKRCGFRTLQLAPTDLDTPLTTRTNTANRAKADALVSVHFNAMGNTFDYSSARGFSVHIQEGLSNSSQSYKLAELMVQELSKGTPQVNRGVVKQNLAITRQSAMTAVLVECGFMDDPGEALLMISDSFHREVARELATALCRYFGVPYKGSNVTPASNPIRTYLIEGDTGAKVRELQQNLNKAGFSLSVDGIYGNATTSAVKAFQRGNGLVADGVFGIASAGKLDAVLANLSKPTTVTKPKEEDDMLKQAIVIGSLNDYAAAELLSIRKGIPIYPRNAIKAEVAKELIVVGGNVKGLEAEKITNLSGSDRFKTAENVENYLKK